MIVGPVEFDAPQWLWLAPALWVVVWLLARRSLSGLGRKTKIVALVVRVLVIALLVGSLAEPHLRDESEDVASIVILDVSRSVPNTQAEDARTYIENAVLNADERERLGIVSAAVESYVQSLPSPRTRRVEVIHSGEDDGTDIASGVRLALAGTACGDPSDTACDNPDTCDGAGSCQTNVEPGTTQCRAASGA